MGLEKAMGLGFVPDPAVRMTETTVSHIHSSGPDQGLVGKADWAIT